MAFKQSSCLVCTLILMMFTGCGFLDDDIWLTDEEFEDQFGEGYIEGTGMSGGYGFGYGSGCGGSRGSVRFPALHITAAAAASQEKTFLDWLNGDGASEYVEGQVDASGPGPVRHLTELHEDDEARHEASWGSVFVDLSTRRNGATREFLERSFGF